MLLLVPLADAAVPATPRCPPTPSQRDEAPPTLRRARNRCEAETPSTCGRRRRRVPLARADPVVRPRHDRSCASTMSSKYRAVPLRKYWTRRATMFAPAAAVPLPTVYLNVPDTSAGVQSGAGDRSAARSGATLLSGGVTDVNDSNGPFGDGGDVEVHQSYPFINQFGQTWAVDLTSINGATNVDATAWAICQR